MKKAFILILLACFWAFLILIDQEPKKVENFNGGVVLEKSVNHFDKDMLMFTVDYNQEMHRVRVFKPTYDKYTIGDTIKGEK